MVGEFHNGRGEWYATDTYQDRAALTRAVCCDIKPDSHHFEESYSVDGGRTWRPAFIGDLTRIKP